MQHVHDEQAVWQHIIIWNKSENYTDVKMRTNVMIAMKNVCLIDELKDEDDGDLKKKNN